MLKLHNAKVMVCGTGGVGSFVAEALARSNIGKLILVDFDVVDDLNARKFGVWSGLSFEDIEDAEFAESIGEETEDISTEMLAHSCHMSQTNYRRVFGKIMGTSPMMYLNRIRIEKACEKLFSTTDTIADIAGKEGYTSISAFNNNFKRFMNCSPQQWRKVARLNRK